jgi:hypothetical protein
MVIEMMVALSLKRRTKTHKDTDNFLVTGEGPKHLH